MLLVTTMSAIPMNDDSPVALPDTTPSFADVVAGSRWVFSQDGTGVHNLSAFLSPGAAASAPLAMVEAMAEAGDVEGLRSLLTFGLPPTTIQGRLLARLVRGVGAENAIPLAELAERVGGVALEEFLDLAARLGRFDVAAAAGPAAARVRAAARSEGLSLRP